MTGEIIGDVVAPRELIVPELSGINRTLGTISGALLFISSGKLQFTYGNVTEAITSA